MVCPSRWFIIVNTNAYDSLFHSILVLTSEAGKCGGTDVYCIKPVRCVNRGERWRESRQTPFLVEKREIYINDESKYVIAFIKLISVWQMYDFHHPLVGITLCIFFMKAASIFHNFFVVQVINVLWNFFELGSSLSSKPRFCSALYLYRC
jgi:hypothetical protein